jgi:5'-deoxynucleotidase YfbR-like HD superfamily hydrolase
LHQFAPRQRLKNVLRSAHASEGRRESTAEHSWRLALFAMQLEDELPGLDFARILKMCAIHDLGGAIHGDIPVIDRTHAHTARHPLLAALREMVDEVTRERALGGLRAAR